MLFEKIESEGLAHNSYLIGHGNDAFVIDPRRDCEFYVKRASAAGMRIRFIFETHRNEDYVIGSLELSQMTSAEIWHADKQLPYHYGKPVTDGQEWRIGALKVRAMETPGHTAGMVSYLLHDDEGAPWVLFSGDALFAGDVGRVDLLGADRLREAAGALYDSLFTKILPLGDGIIVCPAHGSGSECGPSISERVWTTIGLEKQRNSKLQLKNRREFVHTVAKDLEKPPYFKQMERLNIEGRPIIISPPTPTPLDPLDFGRSIPNSVVLDTRLPGAFASSHIPGAISIWTDGLPSFGGWFLKYDRPLLLVTEEGETQRAVRYLMRIGFTKIEGRLSGGMHAWHMAGQASVSSGIVTVREMCEILDKREAAWILDVRSDQELEKEGHITNAHPIHITQLPKHVSEIPQNLPVYIFCGSGLRSTIAASLLQKAGWKDLWVVLGGVAGWNSITCPISKSNGR